MFATLDSSRNEKGEKNKYLSTLLDAYGFNLGPLCFLKDTRNERGIESQNRTTGVYEGQSADEEEKKKKGVRAVMSGSSHQLNRWRDMMREIIHVVLDESQK